MEQSPDPEVVATTIRLPRTLLERVDEIAKADRRSRNATVILLLERAAQL